MKRPLKNRRFLGRLRSWPILVVVGLLIVVGVVWGLRIIYNHDLGPVDPSSTKTVYFTVVSGSTVHQIGDDLKQSNLIRSEKTFETYVRSRGLFESLQYGTYALSQSMSTQQIVQKLVNGDVAKNLLTILPGKTINDIKDTFKKAGYSSSEIAAAFDPSNYSDIPFMANLPAGASLEGLLYPDSWQQESNTPAQTIIRESLDEMQDHLTSDIVTGFKASGLNVYQGLTLASIVYQESGDPSTEPTIAQVFLSRIKQGMPLQSNVTADYASDLAGVPRSVDIDSPYNTYLHKGLPPGPISNMMDSALKAVAHPSDTDYLYFIAGDDGTIHFSHNEVEHEQAIQKYCKVKCS
ncbi:MAG TPA: endolytic transglycosylase MltG [Candidatus Saccharimonadales bacterium]|nr:endolytic transglycosylase MltG [Candidatus Saccharimonadales bacterium]